MGGHGQQILNLAAFQGEGEGNGPGLHQGKPRNLGDGVLILVEQLGIDDGLEPQQMIRRCQNLEKQPILPEDPVELLGYGQGEKTGHQPRRPRSNGEPGRRGTEPLCLLVPAGGEANRLLGNIQPQKLGIQGGLEAGAVVALTAAHIQNGPLGVMVPGCLNQGLENGGVKAAVQKFPPGGDLIPGIPGVEGALVLHGQKVHIALTGNIKTVPLGAALGGAFPGEKPAAEGTIQIHGITCFLMGIIPHFFPAVNTRRPGVFAMGGHRMRKLCSLLLVCALLGIPVRGESPKYVALTFDDGPSGRYTRALLEGLAERDAKATFLLCGYRMAQDPQAAAHILSYGHEIGLHGYSHKCLANLTREAVAWELEQTQALLPQGCTPAFLRPPGGLINATVEAEARARGLGILTWNVDPRDWATRDAAQVEAAVVSQVGDGDVVLLHDMSYSSVEAALAIVDRLKAQGFTFVTVSQLARLRGRAITPGKTYTSFPPEKGQGLGK